MKKTAYLLFATLSIVFASCSSDDDNSNPEPEIITFDGDNDLFQLESRSNLAISGVTSFTEDEDGNTIVTLKLSGTTSGDSHPSHIHFNSAAEGGAIAITLSDVDGETGISTTVVSQYDDGTSVSYEQLMQFDGYINTHLSVDRLDVLIAQGDIGTNELTGNTKEYKLFNRDIEEAWGTATFSERVNGTALVTLDIENDDTSDLHIAHIHMNSAAEGGEILATLNSVDGNIGISRTSVEVLDDGTTITYNELLDFDGYINVHLSAEQANLLVAQGDIGSNELNGNAKEFQLFTRDIEGITGTALFEERVNGTALVTLALDNDNTGESHPAHIHMNSAAEGGAILYTFNNVVDGISRNSAEALNDGTTITYNELLDFDGYINVHLSVNRLDQLVVQGDIGSNELNGNAKEFQLFTRDIEGITGTALFEERVNGTALVTLALDNDNTGESHPAHIHMNTAIEGGAILYTFNNVVDGISKSSAEALNDGTAITYNEFLDFDGYINVHLSVDRLDQLVAQGDIGQNELTVNSEVYNLGSVSDSTISGTATFSQRVNEETLVTIQLAGTTEGNTHPAHIHMGAAPGPGAIIVSLNQVVGGSGTSGTNVTQLEDSTSLTYADMISIDGYINVHLSTQQLDILIAQGNAGANAI